MGIEYKIIVMGSMVMDLLIGTLFLFLVLVIFTLFTYKAPNGMRAMEH